MGPATSTSAHRARPDRVFYLCDWIGESGGIKVLYDHVAALRRLGVDARLASRGLFERCTWFDHNPAAIPATSNVFSELWSSDILVLPEFCMRDRDIAELACRQVAFVQNPDLMTGSIHEPRYESVLVPSRQLAAWIREDTGYRRGIHLVHGFLESELVRPPRTFTTGAPKILVIERLDKHRGEPARVATALCELGMDVTFVDYRVPRSVFVQRFVEHDIYLHLSYREGFPVSILEAFGAGCLVAGFSGRGGLEFMRDADNCFVVPDGDWRATVARVESMVADRSGLDTMLSRARDTASRFTQKHVDAQLRAVFHEQISSSAVG